MVDTGYGSNLSCRLCGNLIVESEVEYEVTGPHGGIVHTHLACFNTWNEESKAGGGNSPDPLKGVLPTA
jgi:hypothetical protein